MSIKLTASIPFGDDGDRTTEISLELTNYEQNGALGSQAVQQNITHFLETVTALHGRVHQPTTDGSQDAPRLIAGPTSDGGYSPQQPPLVRSDSYVKIRMKGVDPGEECSYYVSRVCNMGTLIDAYAAHIGWKPSRLRFLIEGHQIKPEDTPRSIEDGDVVDVFREIIGPA